MEQMQDYM
jgi:septal ring factor EnvC (AmiA/AmiB activator)